jgi:2-keto-4-pentenoate hydratase/2-oxohepta-3-ene-1,7-dioic acid hydratase in catechol pathway
MTWKFEDCIAHLSQAQTLEPGEVIGSGTVGGGCAVEVGRTVKPGDVIELEVEKIGLLRSRIDPNKVDQLSAPLERNARA